MKTAFQKKAYSILTALVLLLTACTGAVFSSSRAAALELEGTGKADNPYLLSTAAERRIFRWKEKLGHRLAPMPALLTAIITAFRICSAAAAATWACLQSCPERYRNWG